MYDDERKILTDRLDKPVIHNRKKIRDKYRQDIQTMGQKQHISTAEDMKPVSYTHLDVYKRQL